MLGGRNIKADQLSCLQSTIKKCLSICGVEFYSINTLLDKVTNVKINRVLKDMSHPLFSRVLFSKRRQGRLLSIKTKTERHRKSFLPRSVRNYIEIWSVIIINTLLTHLILSRFVFLTCNVDNMTFLVCVACKVYYVFNYVFLT